MQRLTAVPVLQLSLLNTSDHEETVSAGAASPPRTPGRPRVGPGPQGRRRSGGHRLAVCQLVSGPVSLRSTPEFIQHSGAPSTASALRGVGGYSPWDRAAGGARPPARSQGSPAPAPSPGLASCPRAAPWAPALAPGVGRGEGDGPSSGQTPRGVKALSPHPGCQQKGPQGLAGESPITYHLTFFF